MHVDRWATELMRLAFLLALSVFLLVTTGKDAYISVTKGQRIYGHVNSVGKQDPSCTGRCSFQSWVTLENGKRSIAKFRLIQGKDYKFSVIAKNSKIVSAVTWNPVGNKEFGSVIALLFLKLVAQRLFVLLKGFENVHT